MGLGADCWYHDDGYGDGDDGNGHNTTNLYLTHSIFFIDIYWFCRTLKKKVFISNSRHETKE